MSLIHKFRCTLSCDHRCWIRAVNWYFSYAGLPMYSNEWHADNDDVDTTYDTLSTFNNILTSNWRQVFNLLDDIGNETLRKSVFCPCFMFWYLLKLIIENYFNFCLSFFLFWTFFYLCVTSNFTVYSIYSIRFLRLII